MARCDDSKIADRIEQHQREDVRRKWESAVKPTDPAAVAVSDNGAIDAIADRFDSMERSIATLRRENLNQAEAHTRHRTRSRVLLVAAVLGGAVAGGIAIHVADRPTSDTPDSPTPPSLPPRRAVASHR